MKIELKTIDKFFLLASPFLLSLSKIVHYTAYNIDMVTGAQFFIATITSLFFALIINLSFGILIKDKIKSAIAATLFLFIFFQYKIFFDAVWRLHFFKEMFMVHIVLAVIVTTLIFRGALFLKKSTRDFKPFAKLLSIMTLIIVVPNVFLATYHSIKIQKNSDFVLTRAYPKGNVLDNQDEGKPDIYYIILDGYARADALKKHFNFDNSDFLSKLSQKGFITAEKSFSNYTKTYLSLASSLNMKYINDLGAPAVRHPFYEAIKNPIIAQYLQSKGYSYIHFDTFWKGTETSYISDKNYNFSPILGKEFYNVLIRSTMLSPILSNIAESYLYMFERLKEIPDFAGPTFTFVHFTIPHNPYVFDRNGDRRRNIPLSLQFQVDRGGWERKNEYIDQLIYLNKKVDEFVSEIIKKSKVRPIIILQADHGTSSMPKAKEDMDKHKERNIRFFKERHAILNSYLIPSKCNNSLYPEITPVNSFRVLFNCLFDDKFEILEDKIYFSYYKWKHQVDITSYLIEE